MNTWFNAWHVTRQRGCFWTVHSQVWIYGSCQCFWVLSCTKIYIYGLPMGCLSCRAFCGIHTAGLAEWLLQLDAVANRHLGNASSLWTGRSPQQNALEAAHSSRAQCRRALSCVFLVAVTSDSKGHLSGVSSFSMLGCSSQLQRKPEPHWQQTLFWIIIF